MTACPVCHQNATTLWSAAKDFEYFTSDRTYHYFHCSQCKSIFIHPVPVAELRSIYPSNYYSFVSTKKNIVTRIKETLDKRHFRKILRQINTKQVRVLDVGGGTGWLAGMIRKLDERVHLTQVVDIDPAAKGRAEKDGHLYFEGILEDFNTEERYELILMLNLIEHVADPLAVMKKAAELLAPGGVILIKTPNTESLDARLFKNTYWGGLHCPRHWVIFSERSFRMLLNDTGLQVVSLDYTQGGPFWAFSIIIALYRKGWLKVNAERPVIFHPLFPFISAATAAFDFLRSPFSKTSQMFILLRHSS